MSDLSKDVPVLNLAQFSALHMAISVQGIEYRISGEHNLDGWCVIAKLSKAGGVYREPSYILLPKPVESEGDDDWNTPDPAEDGMEPYDYVKDDYNYREKGK